MFYNWKKDLTASYIRHVGYDPFKDDPSLSCEEVEEMLQEVLIESRSEDHAYYANER